MRRATAVLAFLFLSAIPISLGASDRPSIDFDQGLNVGEILKATKARASKNRFLKRSLENARPLLIPPIVKLSVPLVELIEPVVALAGPGHVYGPWQPRILDSQVYLNAIKVRAHPVYRLLKPNSIQELEAEWQPIEPARSSLHSEASGLETQDKKLYDDREALKAEKIRLDNWRFDLNARIDTFNRECGGGRPLPPDEYEVCSRRRAALVAEQGRLSAATNTQNANVDEWNNRSSALFNLAKAFVQKIDEWENKIAAWLNSAQAAFNQDLPKEGWCRVDEIKKDSFGKITQCKILCLINGVYQTIVFNPVEVGRRNCGAENVGDFFPARGEPEDPPIPTPDPGNAGTCSVCQRVGSVVVGNAEDLFKLFDAPTKSPEVKQEEPVEEKANLRPNPGKL